MLSADELNRQGGDLYLKGDIPGARLFYLAALETDSGYLPALANMAATESALGNLTSAASYARRVVNNAPLDGSQWNNLGNILTRLDRFEEAEDALRRATSLSPELPGNWHNLALLYLRWRRYADANATLDKVERLGSRGHGVQNDRAHILLAQGHLNKGVEVYESRWHTLPHLPPWDFHIPEWKGEGLHGKRILFHGEQGLGDSIMCSRFAKTLVDRGAQVTLCIPKCLASLFETQNWHGVDVLAMEGMEEDFDPTGFDFQSPMYSAMRWLGLETKDISSEPYLEADGRISELQNGKFNVGICWASGKRNNENDWRRRVTPLELWLPLAENPDIRLWSLQKGADEDEIINIGAEGLVGNLTHRFSDFLDTAIFIQNLDLVVTVDTAIAHLAGAFGKQTIMLSQYSNCWRWWNIDSRSARPWYDSIEILRQPTPNDWATPLGELPELIRACSARQMPMAAE